VAALNSRSLGFGRHLGQFTFRPLDKTNRSLSLAAPNQNGKLRPTESRRPQEFEMLEPGNEPLHTHSLQLRVCYQETDGQRRVHHANYLNYFERGRVEMLRAAGVSYRDFEDSGLMLVVIEMNVRYHSAAQFDDLLNLSTTLTEVRKVRIRHRYTIHRDDELIVEADSMVACVDREGNPKRLPDLLLTPT
jgi:acyl-CoA thioester hydrolase